MGAQIFQETVSGKTAKEAFRTAVQEAAYMQGHGGYTGTIAEKSDFVEIDPTEDGQDVDGWTEGDYDDYAYELCREDDPRISDKWGPAGCMKMADDCWIFFGWASS